jgi:hypothetical protein
VNDNWKGICILVAGAVVMVVITAFLVGLSIGADYVRKDAVAKGAAVYRIAPGTMKEVEFVWKSDMEAAK